MTEHYYTSKGRQRAVFFIPDVSQVRFGVELKEGDEACVEVSYDPVEVVRKGLGKWEVFEGGLGGEVVGTALRLNIQSVEGWVKLTVEQEKQ